MRRRAPGRADTLVVENLGHRPVTVSSEAQLDQELERRGLVRARKTQPRAAESRPATDPPRQASDATIRRLFRRILSDAEARLVAADLWRGSPAGGRPMTGPSGPLTAEQVQRARRRVWRLLTVETLGHGDVRIHDPSAVSLIGSRPKAGTPWRLTALWQWADVAAATAHALNRPAMEWSGLLFTITNLAETARATDKKIATMGKLAADSKGRRRDLNPLHGAVRAAFGAAARVQKPLGTPPRARIVFEELKKRATCHGDVWSAKDRRGKTWKAKTKTLANVIATLNSRLQRRQHPK